MLKLFQSRLFMGLRLRTNLSDIAYTEKSYNQVQLLGRVGADAKIRGEHTKFAHFNLATSEYADGASSTMWHNIIAFSPNLVENVCARVVKGDRLLVSGRISYRSDDQGRKHTRIIAQQIINLTNRFYDAVEESSEDEGLEVKSDMIFPSEEVKQPVGAATVRTEWLKPLQ